MMSMVDRLAGAVATAGLRVVGLADVQVRIPGSGAVQSLNVAVACGIVLAEACRGTSEPAKNPRK